MEYEEKVKKVFKFFLVCAMGGSPAVYAQAGMYNSVTSIVSVSDAESDFVIEDGILKKYIGSGGDVVIPDNITCIADRAFYNCSELTEITIPNSVTSIGSNAFFGCSGLENIIIPNSVTSIGDKAFYNCSELENIDLPVELNNIGGDVFCNTKWIENKREDNPIVIVNSVLIDGKYCDGDVIIPDGVTKIASRAFFHCYNSINIMMSDSVTSIESYAFYRCSGLNNITISNNVTSIGSKAFEDCSGLKNITIPNSVTSIGSSAFRGCSGLKNITISNSVTSIGNSVFQGCEKLTKIMIPESVTSIIESAFWGCNSLTNIVGYKNSYAEIYAKENGFTFIDIASSYDFNSDGRFDLYDAKEILEVVLGQKLISDSQKLLADIDQNGRIDFIDSYLCFKAAVRIIALEGYSSYAGNSGMETKAVPDIKLENNGKGTYTVTISASGDMSALDYGFIYDSDGIDISNVEIDPVYRETLENGQGLVNWSMIKNYDYIVLGDIMTSQNILGDTISTDFSGDIMRITFEADNIENIKFALVKDSHKIYDKMYLEGYKNISMFDYIKSGEAEAEIYSEDIIDVPAESTTPSVEPTEVPTTTEPAIATPVATPNKVDAEKVLTKEEATAEIAKVIEDAAVKIIEIVANASLTITKDMFNGIIENGKTISVSVADEDNNLKYVWSFKNRTLFDATEDVDLTVDFSTEGETVSEISQVAGADDILCMDYAYKGDLPGVATMKTYVGNKFGNGEKVYLYRYDNKSEKTTIKADENIIKKISEEGMEVKDGYVEFAIDCGSTYFLTTADIKDAELDTVVERTWIYGDIDSDGRVTLQDVTMILKAALGIVDVTGVEKATADMDSDGKVSLKDAQIGLKTALGIEKNL